jgi:hypothetical protein
MHHFLKNPKDISEPAKFSELQELISSLINSNCVPVVFRKFGKYPYMLTSLSLDTRTLNTKLTVIMCREGESAYMYTATHLTLSLLYIQFFQNAYYVELALPTSKLLIGSVYRPNINHPNLSQSEQFNPILTHQGWI